MDDVFSNSLSGAESELINMSMLFKGVIFMLIFGLFISRLIPKYTYYRETNIVNLLGVDWTGATAALILVGVMVLGLAVLAIAFHSFYLFFTGKNNPQA